MARYACVHSSNQIWEAREGDVPPSYTPENCRWEDITGCEISDHDLVGATYVDGQVVPRPDFPAINPQDIVG